MKFLIAFGLFFAVPAPTEVLDKSAVIAGMKVQYRVVLPPSTMLPAHIPACLLSWAAARLSTW